MQDDTAHGSGKGWQRELDELELRQRHAKAMGGADKVRAPARRRPPDHSRAYRPAGRPRVAARDRIGRRCRGLRRAAEPPVADAVQSHLGPRHDRRPAGDRVGRRLYRARRLGRCDHPREDRDRRAHGQRAAAPHHPHCRRLGRRRIGEDDRDDGPRQPAGRPRRLVHALQVHDRQSGARCRWWPLASAPSPGLARRRSPPATTPS